MFITLHGYFVIYVPRWCNFFSIINRQHGLRRASGEGDVLSPHGALRAYTVFLTAEPRRGSLMMELLQYQG
ncbi:MAG: hypothetical protein MR030_03340 [Bacteroidales bacterium]|nr:hypothetical protein [Bacteroidales bacterium]